ncbi:MAG: glycosyltransferase [Azospirillaceae bacterium]
MPMETDSAVATPDVTIVVTPRERFGLAEASLLDILDTTDIPFRLVYVDSGAPAALSRRLEALSRERGFELLRAGRALAPNEARNLGLSRVDTPYVAFLENDVFVTPGWLGALVACARETGAAVVAPLICQGSPLHRQVHHAGGLFADDPDAFVAPPAAGPRPAFEEVMIGHARPREEIDPTLARGETQFFEFHCVLMRRDLFERTGPFDEAMLATKEHVDFAMTVRKVGERVWFEPASVVTYLFPCRAAPLSNADLPYFMLRWSNAWQRRSLVRFRDKWRIDAPDYFEERWRSAGWRRYEAITKRLVARAPVLRHTAWGRYVARKAISASERMVCQALVLRADLARRAARRKGAPAPISAAVGEPARGAGTAAGDKVSAA